MPPIVTVTAVTLTEVFSITENYRQSILSPAQMAQYFSRTVPEP